ncbi:MAG: hypothetical protein LBQ13_02890 [Endomicrobium sp.]|jgi:hypothetical protein|nr:hypothetical protein [Endomicrobium sp.]
MKITGSKASVFLDSFDNSNVVIGDGSIETTAKHKYFVISKAATSSIPVPEGTFFIAPAGVSQITLAVGDRVLKIEPDRFCKTTASFEFAMGSVEAGDDCDPGATISDGILTISGSLAGLFRYDDATQDLDNVTEIVVNRFLDIIEDDGAGVYTLHKRNDEQIYLLTLLNSGGAVGTTENWLFVPINITSMSMSLGNTDVQNKDLSFSKGEGQPIIYKVPVSA